MMAASRRLQMSKSPTPEQLGDMLKAGRITEAEAREIMAKRVRQEALGSLFKPLPREPGDSSGAQPEKT